MRFLFPLFLLLSCLLALLPSCEPKEELVQTTGSLELQADTVLFDTVFTSIRTVTKRLWVYNRNAGAVRTDVSLAGTAGATYSLVINGDAGSSAPGVLIRGKDSLLVLVRAVLGDNGTAAKPFLLADELLFRTNGGEQRVKLVAYGQNAYFHRGEVLTSNTTWAADKPHVIINAAAGPAGQRYLVGVQVGPGATLRIPKGTRIYSHAGAYLLVEGRLLVNDDFVPGTAATDTVRANDRNIVRFQGDRLEPFYAEIPGQWGGIVFTSSSRGNSIRYTEIKNATFGALLNNPEGALVRPSLKLDNTVIRNISGANLSFANATAKAGGGVISYSGDVTATNCLFTNCGEYAVLGVGGGTYDFNFCTFANFTPAFRRETASLTFTNAFETSTGAVKRFTSVSIRNSIVWGSFEDELLVENFADYITPTSIRNTVLRTKLYATVPQVSGGSGVNLLNTDPLFRRTSLTSSRPDYRLLPASPAAAGKRGAIGPLPTPLVDLLNLRRDATAPALGAYESK